MEDEINYENVEESGVFERVKKADKCVKPAIANPIVNEKNDDEEDTKRIVIKPWYVHLILLVAFILTLKTCL